MSPKTKLKNFFQVGEGSESAVELLMNWIIPFSRGMKKASVDDVLAAFFALDSRKIVYLKAKRSFTLPGKYFVAGNRPIYGAGLTWRKIKRNDVLLVAVDRVDGTARIEIGPWDNAHVFLLEKFEFETIKDWLDVIES